MRVLDSLGNAVEKIDIWAGYVVAVIPLLCGIALAFKLRVPYFFDPTPGNVIALVGTGVCTALGTMALHRSARAGEVRAEKKTGGDSC